MLPEYSQSIMDSELTPKSRLLVGTEYTEFSWHAPPAVAQASHLHLYHRDVMNYGRIPDAYQSGSCIKAIPSQCIMCGRCDVLIPCQNKNICKLCDSAFWLHLSLQKVFKFCKGCKNFFFLEEFTDKPRGTKCEKCRQRGKELYHMKKQQGSEVSSSEASAVSESSSKRKSPSQASPFLLDQSALAYLNELAAHQANEPDNKRRREDDKEDKEEAKEWDPDTSRLMQLAMLTEHHNF